MKLGEQLREIQAKVIAEILRLDANGWNCPAIAAELGMTAGQVSGLLFRNRARAPRRGARNSRRSVDDARRYL